MLVASQEDLGVYPENCEQADVLIVATNAEAPSWFEVRGVRVAEHLVEQGTSAAAVSMPKITERNVSRMVSELKPRLVLNRAMLIHSDTVVHVAAANPDVKFATVCHSSVGDLGRSPFWMAETSRTLSAAAVMPNIYFAHVDEQNPFAALFGDKSVWLPNIVARPLMTTVRKRHDPPTVSIVCGNRPLKNISTQLLAVAVANQTTPLRCIVSLSGDEPQWLQPFCRSLQLSYEFRPWSTWLEFTRMLAMDVDVGLQASYTESFNFVALEHLLCGKPVVGSPAIRYLPPQWQADPNDVGDLAAHIIDRLNNWDRDCQAAMNTAESVCVYSNRQATERIQELLDRPLRDADMRFRVNEYFRRTEADEAWMGDDVGLEINAATYAPPPKRKLSTIYRT